MEIGLAIVLVVIGLMAWDLLRISDDEENIEEDIKEERKENE